MNHSKLPWKKFGLLLTNNDNEFIGDFRLPPANIYINCGLVSVPVGVSHIANVSFVVKAVNNHYRLYNALKAVSQCNRTEDLPAVVVAHMMEALDEVENETNPVK